MEAPEHALDGLVKADALNAWAAQVLPDEYNQKALDAFRSRGSEISSAATFLVDMYNARKKSESAWKRVGEVRSARQRLGLRERGHIRFRAFCGE